MAKIVYICFRESNGPIPEMKRNIQRISDLLNPKDAMAAPTQYINQDGIIVGIINPNPIMPIHQTSVCMGDFFEKSLSWWRPLSAVPDGTFALFRGDKDWIELITDVVGTRTIWYIFTKDLLMASTSQRAIVALNKSFEFNTTVIPWLLSSGTLGPGNSWDKRIKPLEAGERLLLNRERWVINEFKEYCCFSHHKTKASSEKELDHVLKKTFKGIGVEGSNWLLPLSGGYDSRAILLFTKKYNIPCITWGTPSSITKEDTDAYVAKKLADSLNLNHRFFSLDESLLPFSAVVEKFLLHGEGRIDHISGYMDGFVVWETLLKNGIKGILRGDEGFGWKPVNSASEVLKKNGIILLSDIWNAKSIHQFHLEAQTLPHWMRQRNNESLASWRDRLYHTFRIPYILAALNDLKLSFVEIVNPLLSRNIISFVRKLPDDLRTDKALFKNLVRSLSPHIPFATKSSTKGRNIIFNQPKIRLFLLNSLESNKILPRVFLDHLHNGYNSDSVQFFNYGSLAFRSHLICEMNRLLINDSKFFKDR